MHEPRVPSTPLMKIHADDTILVVNKPAGVPGKQAVLPHRLLRSVFYKCLHHVYCGSTILDNIF